MNRICTGDLETDPFAEGRFPQPFAKGFYDGDTFRYWWGDNCISEAETFYRQMPPSTVYFHNGGRFDFYYVMRWLAGLPMRVINSRVIKSTMACSDGFHDLRDSYAILPFALKTYKGKTQKKDIEIWKLEREHRETYRDEILSYLEYDCQSLHELCSAFTEKFGDRLTIGSTAMKQIKKTHKFASLDSASDRHLRSTYYYGGRVECFEKGVITGSLKVYDVNSMYPFAMKTFSHPIGGSYREGSRIGPETCFVSVSGQNDGAFPVRTKAGLQFNVGRGVFHVSIHEFQAGLETGMFKPDRIYRTLDFPEQGNFEEFIDLYYGARLKAKSENDAANEMFYKLILNSGYGKFAQNPDRYEENQVCAGGWDNGPHPRCACKFSKSQPECRCEGWSVKEIMNISPDVGSDFWVWRKNAADVTRYNVATGASITGAARSLLMRGLAGAKRPVYCDTDSVICEGMESIAVSGKQLGAWKLEAEGTQLAIGGKKLYAMFDATGKCVKKANKGVVVTAEEITRIAQGETVFSVRDAPSFKLDGSYRWIKRSVRMT